jgi:hypothetical protein
MAPILQRIVVVLGVLVCSFFVLVFSGFPPLSNDLFSASSGVVLNISFLDLFYLQCVLWILLLLLL